MVSVKEHAAASAVGTVAAEILTLPICTLKTRVQNDKAVARVHEWQGVLAAVRTIVDKEGSRAFFRASGIAVTTQVFSTASKFTLYSWLQEQYNADRHLARNVLHGIASGWLSCIVTHPLDVWKIHMQMNTALLPAVAANPRVLYRGFSKTLSKVTLASALFFPLFDTTKRAVGDRPFVAGLLSGLVSTLIIHPLDCAKTRHAYGQPWFYGFSSLRPYYTGLSLNLARTVPHFAIVMGVTAAIEKKTSLMYQAQQAMCVLDKLLVSGRVCQV